MTRPDAYPVTAEQLAHVLWLIERTCGGIGETPLQAGVCDTAATERVVSHGEVRACREIVRWARVIRERGLVPGVADAKPEYLANLRALEARNAAKRATRQTSEDTRALEVA